MFAEHSITKRYVEKFTKEIAEKTEYIREEIIRTSDTFIPQVIDERAKLDALRIMLRTITNENIRRDGVSAFEKSIKNAIACHNDVVLSNDATYVRFNLVIARELDRQIRYFMVEYNHSEEKNNV